MKKKIFFVLAVVMVVVGGAIFCYPKNQRPTSATVPVADDKGATPAGINSVISANNQFALDLYSELKKNEGNVFFSPYSISTALAMVYEGARGKTGKEIQAVFHFRTD